MPEKNRTSTLLLLYILLCLLHIAALLFQSKTGVYFTKPLLMTTLAGWFYLETRNRFISFNRLILAGLILSIAGDTFLMFVSPGYEHFFLLGLGSFLLTHIFYITAFSKYPVLKNGIVRKKRWLILPFLGYAAGFSFLIWEGIPGDFKMPVLVYALVISVMAASSLNLKGRVSGPAFYSIFYGAVLFVVSDSMIALKKFKFPDASEETFSLLIMATYLAGQYLIAKGARDAGFNGQDENAG